MSNQLESGVDSKFQLKTLDEEKEFRPLDPRLEAYESRVENIHPAAPHSEPEGEGVQSKDEDEGTVVVTPAAQNEIVPRNVVYIEFEKDDPRDPFNFPRTRKWMITLTACALTGFSAAVGSTYASGYDSMKQDLNCSQEQASAGFSLYALGFSLAPLVLASFSEEFGRKWMYTSTTFVFTVFFIPVALAKNIQTVLISRFIQGAASSTGSTMVGGTVADIWAPHERGLPMSIFALSAIGGTGLGPVIAGLIEQNKHLQWRWIQWMNLIYAGSYFVWMVLVMHETRTSVILTKQARKLRAETGDMRYRARAEDERASLKEMIYVSCTRPVYLLATEPVVASFSLWVGFAWGVLYGLVQSIGPVFSTLYDFNSAQSGLIFVSLCVGSLLGFATTFYQEVLYQKHFKRKAQEARLYMACFGGALLPIGCFFYAWTALPNVPWIAPAIGLAILIWGIFLIYLAVFLYLADVYHLYASSALAGQSLIRNLMGTAFPLFTDQMYETLSYKWASTTFGFIALILAAVPFILFFWGPSIRARSRFAMKLEHAVNN